LLVAGRRSSRACISNEHPGSYHVSNGSYGSTSLGGTVEGGTVESESLDATGDSVSTGLERWKAAISMTTMQMMERRMAQSLHPTPPSSVSGGSRQSPAVTTAGQHQAVGAPAAAGAAKRLFGVSGQPVGPATAASGGRATPAASGVSRSNSSGADVPAPAQQPLRLQMLIGQGSFGSVYLGTW
jgi:hypothetical protein